MDFTTTVTRNVEIPPTLPDMDTLTDLTGNITIKDVRFEEDGLRVEGDLLWRGYFEEGGSDCLWEGAEFFSEHLNRESVQQDELPLLTPKIVGLRGEALSESTFRMEFDIKWEEAITQAPKENTSVRNLPVTEATAALAEAAAPIQSVSPASDISAENTSKQEISERKRQNPKAVSAETEQKKDTVNTESPGSCPCPQFCLRYYRVAEAENLEKIAERFSASVSKLKAYNNLDFDEVKPGEMIRIP